MLKLSSKGLVEIGEVTIKDLVMEVCYSVSIVLLWDELWTVVC